MMIWQRSSITSLNVQETWPQIWLKIYNYKIDYQPKLSWSHMHFEHLMLKHGVCYGQTVVGAVINNDHLNSMKSHLQKKKKQ